MLPTPVARQTNNDHTRTLADHDIHD